MKVIDLLNKIANGEEVPKKIKSYQGQIYLYEDGGEYVCIETQDLLFDFPAFRQLGDYLNDEVETIEEDKKIKTIDCWYSMEDIKNNPELYNIMFVELKDKINEIIDYLEENK